MTVKQFSLLTLILLPWLLISCTLSSASSPSVEGSKLLIQLDELPPGWVLKEKNKTPYGNSIYWTAVYSTAPDTLDVAKEIFHGVDIFYQEKDAIIYWDEYRKRHMEPAIPEELRNADFHVTLGLPESYDYRSNVADQFEILCYTMSTTAGQAGHNCEALARYGNVFSVFSATIVPDGVDTAQPGEAGLLHGAEMVELLELIDKKLQEAGLGSN